jgi:hypothetical protein
LETNAVTAAELGLAEGVGLLGEVGLAGRATRKRITPALAPRTFSAVVTVTVSPPVKGLVGMKLTPCASLWAFSAPVCALLTEPVTVTLVVVVTPGPRKLMVVAGAAVWLPGGGNALTVPLVARSDFDRAGVGVASVATFDALLLEHAVTATPLPTSRPRVRRVSVRGGPAVRVDMVSTPTGGPMRWLCAGSELAESSP